MLCLSYPFAAADKVVVRWPHGVSGGFIDPESRDTGAEVKVKSALYHMWARASLASPSMRPAELINKRRPFSLSPPSCASSLATTASKFVCAPHEKGPVVHAPYLFCSQCSAVVCLAGSRRGRCGDFELPRDASTRNCCRAHRQWQARELFKVCDKAITSLEDCLRLAARDKIYMNNQTSCVMGD